MTDSKKRWVDKRLDMACILMVLFMAVSGYAVGRFVCDVWQIVVLRAGY